MTHQTLLIRRGESRVLRAPAGSRFLTTRGCVRLAEPVQWLGERIVRIDATLRGDQTHVVEVGGWITLHAVDESVVACDRPGSAWSRWLGLCRMIRTGRTWHAAA